MHFFVMFDQFPGKLQAIYFMDLLPIFNIGSKSLEWAKNSWDGQQIFRMGSKSLGLAANPWDWQQNLRMGSKALG